MTARTIDELPALVAADRRLVHRGRWVTTTFLLGVGDADHLVEVRHGEIESVRQGPFVMPTWQFALRAPADEWAAFWSAEPPPGSHDVFALLKRRVLRAEGDLHPFMANLLYFKGVLATLREATS